MAGRFFVAVLAFAIGAGAIGSGPAAAEFVPLTMIQNDIQRALGRLDQRVNPKPIRKAKKGAAIAPADAPAAKTAPVDPSSDKVPDTSAASAPPLPRLRPAAAPETIAAAPAPEGVGGFKAEPQFSEADEGAPGNAADPGKGVGGYLSAGDTSEAALATEDEPLGYAAAQPPLPRVNPRISAAMANIPGASQPASGKPIRLAALPPADDGIVGPVNLARLNALGVSAKALPAIEESACGMPDPVIVASLDDGDIPLSGVAKVNQTVAMTFATWIRDDVELAARSALDAPLTGLRIADSYSCRTRDHIKNAKLSEHAFGNAIDVGAFRIGKDWITVGGSHTASEQAFLDKVRASACGPFKTVLGPGSDSFHTDHFHLDLAKRRTGGPSRGLYCH